MIVDFIADASPAAAVRMSELIVAGTERLSMLPLLERYGRVAGTRELVISSTPYLAYRVQEERVQIPGVLHAARDWPSRF